MNPVLRAYILLALTAAIWGGNVIAGKLAVGHISPMLLTMIRWVMALGLMLLFAWPQVRRDRAVIRRHLPFLILLGAIGFAAFNLLFYTALQYTSAINVAIVQGGMPAIIFLLNFVLFHIRATVAQVIGFILTLVGVAIVAANGSLGRLLALEVNFGDALMLIAVVIYGGYTVALRFKPDIHWQSMMTVLSAAALLMTIPFAAWEIASGAAIWPDTQGYITTAYTAIFPSLVSQVLYIKGNEIIGSNRAGLFVNLVPIFGTLMSVAIIGEELHLFHIVALVLVLGGIAIAERRRQAGTA
jgi:Predicted membrane protein